MDTEMSYYLLLLGVCIVFTAVICWLFVLWHRSHTRAWYKGREYRVLYSGPTKFGYRTHLQFLDRSKDFWVDEDKVGR